MTPVATANKDGNGRPLRSSGASTLPQVSDPHVMRHLTLASEAHWPLGWPNLVSVELPCYGHGLLRVRQCASAQRCSIALGRLDDNQRRFIAYRCLD